jgi:uncharacterized protein
MTSSELSAVKAAAFDRLVALLQTRTDVQNLDLMNLAGFCRNCLSNWLAEAALADGVACDKEQARTLVYGMPYVQWKAMYQGVATPEQLAKFAAAQTHG